MKIAHKALRDRDNVRTLPTHIFPAFYKKVTLFRFGLL